MAWAWHICSDVNINYSHWGGWGLAVWQLMYNFAPSFGVPRGTSVQTSIQSTAWVKLTFILSCWCSCVRQAWARSRVRPCRRRCPSWPTRPSSPPIPRHAPMSRQSLPTPRLRRRPTRWLVPWQCATRRRPTPHGAPDWAAPAYARRRTRPKSYASR